MEKTEQLGVVYVFRNPLYSENIVKIGSTRYIDKRFRDFSTYSYKPCELLYISPKTPHYKKIEVIIHNKLKFQRIIRNREYFQNVSSFLIESLIDEILLLSDTEIIEKYNKSKQKIRDYYRFCDKLLPKYIFNKKIEDLEITSDDNKK